LDKYFIPFVEPREKRDFKTRELQEILPEHNEGIYAVPQILTNRADGCIKLIRALQQMGYQEINLNLGCPSKTVVTKKKGAGFLAYPEELDHFLEEIFSQTSGKISVKTRIGKEQPEEFFTLLEIYNRYPLEELIIHPRVQVDYYNNEPRMEVFSHALKHSKNPVCYNGDLFSAGRIAKFVSAYPDEDRVMIGRGLIMDPGLLCGENSKEQFRDFLERICRGYLERGMDERQVLRKLKELWFYQIHLFPESDKYAKQIKKAQTLLEYRGILDTLFGERVMRPLP
jgi:tRNA-dihydrouridine synthase